MSEIYEQYALHYMTLQIKFLMNSKYNDGHVLEEIQYIKPFNTLYFH